MERVTISMPDEFAAELADFMDSSGHDNRSEALRDLARLGLHHGRLESGNAGECLATLSYVYNHHTRELSKRLTDAHHEHHDLHVATMHVHLDDDNCLEVAVLRGEAATLRQFAQGVFAERGVKHGQVNFVPVRLETEAHTHGDAKAHKHLHARPRE